MSAQAKKVFYNRVRRTCLKHGIDIVYDGMPKAVYGIELVKDGQVMFADRSNNSMPWTSTGSGCTKRCPSTDSREA